MDYRIKDLPEEERPREKLREKGVKHISDTDLLSIVLRTGTKGKNVKELSAEILSTYSLEEIANREPDEMKDFEGVSDVKAGQLVAVGELSRRLKKEEREKLESLSDVKARIGDMKFMESEKLRIFYLDSGNEIIKEDEVSGGISNVDFEVREVIKIGLISNASACILAHNHPSGKSDPTREDIETTEEMKDLCDKMGIALLDHVIAGEEITSMKSATGLWKNPE